MTLVRIMDTASGSGDRSPGTENAPRGAGSESVRERDEQGEREIRVPGLPRETDSRALDDRRDPPEREALEHGPGATKPS
jgi:hypothetical protein